MESNLIALMRSWQHCVSAAVGIQRMFPDRECRFCIVIGAKADILNISEMSLMTQGRPYFLAPQSFFRVMSLMKSEISDLNSSIEGMSISKAT